MCVCVSWSKMSFCVCWLHNPEILLACFTCVCVCVSVYVNAEEVKSPRSLQISLTRVLRTLGQTTVWRISQEPTESLVPPVIFGNTNTVWCHKFPVHLSDPVDTQLASKILKQTEWDRTANDSGGLGDSLRTVPLSYLICRRCFFNKVL